MTAGQRVAAFFSGLYYRALSIFASLPVDEQASVYSFTLNGLDGEPINLGKYEGKYMLIVNTASHCGFTPQYKSLEKLHEQTGEKLAILGFPANNFLWQEPGSNNDIARFCSENYSVKFQMFSKVSVKGFDQAPLFRWLKYKTGKSPSWNFCKYLVSPTGEVIRFYPSRVDPLDEQITRYLK